MQRVAPLHPGTLNSLSTSVLPLHPKSAIASPYSSIREPGICSRLLHSTRHTSTPNMSGDMSQVYYDTCRPWSRPQLPWSCGSLDILILIPTVSLCSLVIQSLFFWGCLFWDWSTMFPSSSLLAVYILAHSSLSFCAQVFFEITLTWEVREPDGQSRYVILSNGQFPGPQLNLDYGDDVEVSRWLCLQDDLVDRS